MPIFYFCQNLQTDSGLSVIAVPIQIHCKYIVSHPIDIVNNYFHALDIFQAI
jgi:hypothetical protein